MSPQLLPLLLSNFRVSVTKGSGHVYSRPEDFMPNIQVVVFKACTDEKQMSGAPHRMWEDFDKVFDINWIRREGGSWL